MEDDDKTKTRRKQDDASFTRRAKETRVFVSSRMQPLTSIASLRVHAFLVASGRASPARRSTRLGFSTRATGDGGQGTGDNGRLLSLFSQSPLQFGPRMLAGAVVTVLEEGLGAPQRDLERLQLIVNSDTDDKDQQILAEVEDRIVRFVSLGAEKETELMASLPLPDPLKELLGTQGGVVAERDSKPLASWTITDTMDVAGEGVESIELEEYVTPEVTASGQAASELREIQSAVTVLRENIEALGTNSDESKVGMLRLNIRESANTVKQKLEQQRMGTNSADVDSALLEAKSLLMEVEGL